MIVLNTSSDEQTFTVIPRFEPTATITITFFSEQQNKQTHSFTDDTPNYSNGYLTINNTYDPALVDQNKYVVEIKETGVLCWRGKCFVTDQTDLPKFTINEGVYDEPTQSSNEFIII